MKKFIKGTFELDQNVTDLVAYEDQHKATIDKIIQWAEKFDVAINMGTADDNSYLLEYKIVGNTAGYCKGLLSELRQILKAEWKKTTSIWQGSGDVLWR